MMQLKLVYDRVENTKERSAKLTGDKLAILKCLQNGQCWLVSQLANEIGNQNHASVSANCRNLRHDGFNVKLVKLGKGLNGYVLS